MLIEYKIHLKISLSCLALALKNNKYSRVLKKSKSFCIYSNRFYLPKDIFFFFKSFFCCLLVLNLKFDSISKGKKQNPYNIKNGI